MFQTTSAFSSFSVNDLAQAKHFYGTILQQNVIDKEYMLELHVPSAGSVMLYVKDNHEPATFTVLNFVVPDILAAVTDLRSKGVQMEQYDMPQMKMDEHRIYHDEQMQMKIAWFKDPAGNILSLIEEHGHK